MLKCLRASQQDIPLELSFFSSQSACFSYTMITKSIQPVVVITFFFFKVCFRIFLSRNEAAGKPLKCKKRHKERIERAVKHLIALQ